MINIQANDHFRLNTSASDDSIILNRYSDELVVPAQARAEVAVLKAFTLRFVLRQPRSRARRERQRTLLAELVARLADRAPDILDPPMRAAWTDAAGRLRVIMDQVASYTEHRAVEMRDALIKA